jgi:hypothetical protein
MVSPPIFLVLYHFRSCRVLAVVFPVADHSEQQTNRNVAMLLRNHNNLVQIMLIILLGSHCSHTIVGQTLDGMKLVEAEQPINTFIDVRDPINLITSVDLFGSAARLTVAAITSNLPENEFSKVVFYINDIEMGSDSAVPFAMKGNTPAGMGTHNFVSVPELRVNGLKFIKIEGYNITNQIIDRVGPFALTITGGDTAVPAPVPVPKPVPAPVPVPLVRHNWKTFLVRYITL